jgi:thioredoxin-related protein
MRKHLAPLVALTFLALPQASPAGSKPPDSGKARVGESTKGALKLEWLAFDAAAERAKSQNKHVIVDVYTTWCGWCKVMDKQTYGDPEVAAYLRDNFVLAKVNGEASTTLHWQGRELTERQFARAIGVTGYPATYFLKPSTEMLGGVSGFIRTPEFLIYARYVGTRWYERGKIKDYVDSLRAANE